LPTQVTTPSSATSNSTSGANSNSTSGASATGGNATAGVKNSGNSTNTLSNNLVNTNNLSNTQQQKQAQTQSNASTNNNTSAATSNGDNSNNSLTTVEAPKIPVNTAVAPPVFSTSTCFKGFSGGAQTAVAGLSFGGGGIDKNCAALATAQNLYAMGSRLAACKVIITTKSAKAAGVTMDDCMTVPVPIQRVIVQQPAPISVQPVAPAPVAPVIVYIPQPHEEITVTAPKPAPQSKPLVKRPYKTHNCIVPPSLLTPIPTTRDGEK
jgi:hypothetical protein